MILENAIDMEIIKSLLSLKYRNKRHEVALPPPLMQPQPVRSPEKCRREEPKTKAADTPTTDRRRRLKRKAAPLYQGQEEKTMKEIKIFKNYGCLAAEKRVIYTYGAAAENAAYSDEITVAVPEDWEIYETVSGDIACKAPWGATYGANELLEGNAHPYFAAYDNSGVLHRVQLQVVE